jgi:hypothetical protein
MIYVGGDSYTYGIELNNPLKSRYSFLMQQKLKMSVVNDAWGGASNDRIARKFLEFMNGHKVKPDLVFIMWAPITRSEQYAPEENMWEEQDGFRQVRSPDIFLPAKAKPTKKQLHWRRSLSQLSATQKWWLNIFDQKGAIDSYIRNIMIVQTVCRAGNIPFIMTNCNSSMTLKQVDNFISRNKTVENYTQQRVNLIDSSNWLFDKTWSFAEWAKDNEYPIGPQYHPLEEAHRNFADILTDKVKERVNASD